jgi:hypothetical protein
MNSPKIIVVDTPEDVNLIVVDKINGITIRGSVVTVLMNGGAVSMGVDAGLSLLTQLQAIGYPETERPLETLKQLLAQRPKAGQGWKPHLKTAHDHSRLD